jgi:hypothetical protein
MRCRNAVSSLGLLVIAFLVSGCDGNSNALPVFPVSGQVSYEGKPAAGAKVFLYPVEPAQNSVIPHGIVEDDGTFRISSYGRDDGAPAGRYNATVVWTKPASGDEDGPTLIPLRYGDPKTANLPVEIKGQPNELSPFNLTR